MYIWSKGEYVKAVCLFDTGAMRSFISSDIVEKLKPRKCGETDILGATGKDRRNLYEINIQFNEDNIFSLIKAGEGTVVGEGVDCIIGMDVLSQCNFRIRPVNGNTVLTLSTTPTDP